LSRGYTVLFRSSTQLFLLYALIGKNPRLSEMAGVVTGVGIGSSGLGCATPLLRWLCGMRVLLEMHPIQFGVAFGLLVLDRRLL
jgi:hypothetical protein